MRDVIVALFMLVVAGGASADESARPKGKNCRLKAPPSIAGEVPSSGPDWRVYPRLKDIGPDYRGCQTVWVSQSNGSWSVVFVSVVEGGAAVATWPIPPEAESMGICKYEHGKLLSESPKECATLVKSFPAGCHAKSTKLGIYPAMPKGCKYE